MRRYLERPTVPIPQPKKSHIEYDQYRLLERRHAACLLRASKTLGIGKDHREVARLERLAEESLEWIELLRVKYPEYWQEYNAEKRG